MIDIRNDLRDTLFLLTGDVPEKDKTKQKNGRGVVFLLTTARAAVTIYSPRFILVSHSGKSFKASSPYEAKLWLMREHGYQV